MVRSQWVPLNEYCRASDPRSSEDVGGVGENHSMRVQWRQICSDTEGVKKGGGRQNQIYGRFTGVCTSMRKEEKEEEEVQKGKMKIRTYGN